MVDDNAESLNTELDAMASEFLDSPYSRSGYASWPIDRRLDAYFRHRGLRNVADDGTLCATLLERVMDKIHSASSNRTSLAFATSGGSSSAPPSS